MRRIQIILFLLLTLVCTCLCQAAGVTTSPNFISENYWIQHNPHGDRVILDAQGIHRFNNSVRGMNKSVVDLASFPLTSDGNALKTKVADYQVLEDDLYLNGKLVSERYKNELRSLTNVNGIGQNVNHHFGLVTRRTNVRALPTAQALYYFPNDSEFDVLQETVLDPGEPVVIQHESSNGYFYFVQAYNYAGWVLKRDVALADHATWLQYAKPKDFFVVTAKTLPMKLTKEPETLLWQQGAKLYLYSETEDEYILDVPVRQFSSGWLMHDFLHISKKSLEASAHRGYVPYTSNNILKAAFAHYSMPYGWGGLKNSVDSASLIADVYRTVGIMLPRHADEQAATAGKYYALTGLDANLRTWQIERLTPGATLYMDGHIMLYVGSDKGVPYVIHAKGSYFVNGQRQQAMRVLVSDLSLCQANGKSYLESLQTCGEYR